MRCGADIRPLRVSARDACHLCRVACHVSFASRRTDKSASRPASLVECIGRVLTMHIADMIPAVVG